MRKKSIFLIILTLMIICSFGYFLHINAPVNATNTLKNNGYSNVKIKGIRFFAIDTCGKNAQRLNFEATKNSKKVSGYVCVYQLLDKIYED